MCTHYLQESKGNFSISKVQPTRCNIFMIYLLLYIALCFRRSSTHHQEHKTVHTASGIVKPKLLPAAIMDEMEHYRG